MLGLLPPPLEFHGLMIAADDGPQAVAKLQALPDGASSDRSSAGSDTAAQAALEKACEALLGAEALVDGISTQVADGAGGAPEAFPTGGIADAAAAVQRALRGMGAEVAAARGQLQASLELQAPAPEPSEQLDPAARMMGPRLRDPLCSRPPAATVGDEDGVVAPAVTPRSKWRTKSQAGRVNVAART